MTSIGARQGSGGLKCSRTFLSPMKGARRTEVDCGVSTVFAEGPEPGHSSFWADSWWLVLPPAA